MSRSAVREIQGIGRFKFREGELEDFKRLSLNSWRSCGARTPEP